MARVWRWPTAAEHSWTRECDLWQVPYWLIVLPLTLLSAWLLHFRPRTSKLPEKQG